MSETRGIIEEAYLTQEIVPRIIRKQGEHDPFTADVISRVRRGGFETSITKAIIRKEAIPPSEALEAATSLARRSTNDLREKIGLPVIDEEKMEVFYLPEGTFADVYKRLSDKPHPGLLGFYSNELDQANVALKRWPSYLLGSIAYHELIHKYLEKTISVYQLNRDGSRNLSVDTTRSGLSVINPAKRKIMGTLLNELPNYFYQGKYIEDVLNNPPPELQPEVAERNDHFRKFKKDDSQYVSPNVTDPDGQEKTFLLDNKYIHFDATGNANDHTTFCLMQLAENINNLCGEVNGEPFMQLLLRAKVQLSLLPKVKSALDIKIGKGFFERLRKTEINMDALSLLIDVQGKLFESKASENI